MTEEEIHDRPAAYDGLAGCSWLSRSELNFLTGLLPETGLLVEIGTASGVSAAILADRRPKLRIVCVDTFGDHDLDSIRNVEACRIENWRVNRRPNMNLFVGSSADLSFLCRRNADVVLVDGDHGYAAVKADLAVAEGLLRAGGLLAVHDYDEPALPEVRRATDEFAKKSRVFPTREAFAKHGQHGTLLALRKAR